MGAKLNIGDFDDSSFAPFLEDALMFGDHLDPYAKIAEMRDQGSPHKGEYRFLMGLYGGITKPADAQYYSVFGYDEVAQVLSDPATPHHVKFD